MLLVDDIWSRHVTHGSMDVLPRSPSRCSHDHLNQPTERRHEQGRPDYRHSRLYPPNQGCVSKTIEAALTTITVALARGEEIALTGFGSFSVSDRPARQGRNPRTGEAKAIPASKAPKFKAGKNLKDAVNA